MEKMENITPKMIKSYIELASGIKNLDHLSRKRYLVDCRFTYFALSKKYTKKSLSYIGREVGKDHASVLHGVKVCSDIYGTSSFTANSVYKEVEDKLKILEKEDEPIRILDCMDIDLIHQYYRIMFIKHTDKYHEVLNKLMIRNKDLENKFKIMNKKLYEEIASLSFEDIEEFQKRAELFIKVKKQLKLNRHESKQSTSTSTMVSN